MSAPSFRLTKPARPTQSIPELTLGTVLNNRIRGFETAVVLDLNVLSKMHEVTSGKTPLEASGLGEVIDLLNRIPDLVLVPGFALAEVDDAHYRKMCDSYDAFLKRHCPTYKDAPGSRGKSSFGNDRGHSPLYRNMTDSDKYVFALTYLCILKIQVLGMESGMRPFERLMSFLEYMAEIADIVPAIELEVAAYCFFNAASSDDADFAEFCRDIADNFMTFRKKSGKRNRTASGRLANCMNATRDIMYYRLAANVSNIGLRGWKQDMWLLTGDNGLWNLGASVYCLPNQNGDTSIGVVSVDIPARGHLEYWADYVDAVNELAAKRFLARKWAYDPDQKIKTVKKCIDDCEALIASKLAA